MSDAIEKVETEVVVTTSSLFADRGLRFLAYAKVGGEIARYGFGATAEDAAVALAEVLVEELAAS